MYKLDKDTYRNLFFYGIDNKEEALEGIIFFSYSKDVFQKIIEREEKKRIEEKEQKEGKEQKDQKDQSKRSKEDKEELVKSALKAYLQFYRFVEMNDGKNKFDLNNKEKEKELEQIIRNKLLELETKPEDMKEKEIQKSIYEAQREQDQYELIGWRIDRAIEKAREEEKKNNRELTEDQINKIMAKRIEEIIASIKKPTEKSRADIAEKIRAKLKETKKITFEEEEIHYSKRQRLRFAHFPEGSCVNEKGEIINKDYNVRHWTENLYDILKYLENLEHEDSISYYEMWLNTKLKRAENRKEDKDEKEIEEIKFVKNMFLKRKEEMEKGKMRPEEDYTI